MSKLTDTLNLYQVEQRKISLPISEIEQLSEEIWSTYLKDGAVFVMGNGGGASLAEHFASDLAIHPFVSSDKQKALNMHRLKVHCLNESTGTLTRIANDMGYENIFVEQLKNHSVGINDVVIALSVSGNSRNILNALEYAAKFGATTCCIGKGGKAQDMVDISIVIKGTSQFPGQVGANDNYFHVEDLQGSIAHMITGLLKERVSG